MNLELDVKGLGEYIEVVFDENNINWSSVQKYNEVFLRVTEKYLNELLLTRGQVFLNEVWDALGLKRTSSGAVLGWLFKEDFAEGHINFETFVGMHSTIIRISTDGLIVDKL